MRRRTKTQLERIYDMEIEIEMRKQRDILSEFKAKEGKKFAERFEQVPSQDLVADWTPDKKCIKGSTIDLWGHSTQIRFNFVTNDDHPLMVEYNTFMKKIDKYEKYIKKTKEGAENNAQEHILAFLKDKTIGAPKLEIRKFKLKK